MIPLPESARKALELVDGMTLPECYAVLRVLATQSPGAVTKAAHAFAAMFDVPQPEPAPDPEPEPEPEPGDYEPPAHAYVRPGLGGELCMACGHGPDWERHTAPAPEPDDCHTVEVDTVAAARVAGSLDISHDEAEGMLAAHVPAVSERPARYPTAAVNALIERNLPEPAPEPPDGLITPREATERVQRSLNMTYQHASLLIGGQLDRADDYHYRTADVDTLIALRTAS